MADESKWIAGISARQSVAGVAHIVLQARLRSVWRWLPLAAQQGDRDPEFVHQLRVSVRRAEAALRIFGELLPPGVRKVTRRRLRVVRRAAGRTRDGDVLLGRISNTQLDPPISQKLLVPLKQARADAQRALLAAAQAVDNEDFPGKMAWLLNLLLHEQPPRSRRKFRKYARKALRREARAFHRAARNACCSPSRLHRFRIACKRLRYAIECVAPVLHANVRQDLYPRLSELQGRLGSVNDRAAAAEWYLGFSRNGCLEADRPPIVELATAERDALRAERRQFRQWWSGRRSRRLRRLLDKHAG
jgi:CHAD domain-containing protein